MSEGKTDLVTRVEFPYGSIEDFAMKKVIDPNSNPEDFVIHSFYIDSLRSILERGVYTEEFAERIGDSSYARNYDTDYNRKFISVREGHMGSWGLTRSISVLIKPRKIAEDIPARTDGEKLIHRRANPKDFLGLLSIPSDFRNVLDEALESWRKKPQNSLPIYGIEDKGLLWPIIIPNGQISRMLVERGIK